MERRKTEIEEDNVNANQYHNLKQQHQIKQHEKELLHQRLTSTASHQLQSKIVQMENELDQKKSQWQQRTSNKKEVRKLEMLELEIKEQNAELKFLGKLKESLQVYYSKDASKISVD